MFYTSAPVRRRPSEPAGHRGAGHRIAGQPGSAAATFWLNQFWRAICETLIGVLRSSRITGLFLQSAEENYPGFGGASQCLVGSDLVVKKVDISSKLWLKRRRSYGSPPALAP